MITEEKIDIEKLVNISLPPLPGQALRVAELTKELNSSAKTIANVISSDPGLTTNILRIANSALYSRGKKTTSLLAAVSSLGDKVIYQSVIGYIFSNTLMKKRNISQLETAIWEHSICVALAAREVSIILNMRGTEEVFLCGLLHDIGKLILLRFSPRTYQEIAKIQQEHKMLECEMDAFGYTHAQVGSLVAAKWGLPEEIVFAINNHHQPTEAKTSIVYTHIINIADNLTNIEKQGIRQLEDYELSFYKQLELLNFNKECLPLIWTNVVLNLKELISIWG